MLTNEDIDVIKNKLHSFEPLQLNIETEIVDNGDGKMDGKDYTFEGIDTEQAIDLEDLPKFGIDNSLEKFRLIRSNKVEDILNKQGVVVAQPDAAETQVQDMANAEQPTA
jgi:hypothetical protein